MISESLKRIFIKYKYSSKKEMDRYMMNVMVNSEKKFDQMFKPLFQKVFIERLIRSIRNIKRSD